MKAIVVSYGSIGQRHTENLKDHPSVGAVSLLRRPTEANKSETIRGADRVFFEVQRAVDWRPDFVVIASPATHHVELAVPFVEAGIDLLVEKPLSAASAEARDLMGRVEQRDVVGMVGYNFRFHEPLVRLHRAVDRGQIGRILSIRADVGSYLPDWRPDRDYRQTVSARADLGGGALLELSHELDLARWFGGPVARVGALVDRLSELEMDVEDTAELIVRFGSGAVGHVHLDMVQRPPTRGLKVVGTEGIARWNSNEGKAFIQRSDAEGSDVLVEGDAADWNWNTMYEREIEHFLECIQDRTTPRVTLHDGLKAVELAEAAKQSSDEGAFVDI
ncbi:MAG: Gfo/Idh/MocA family protein [Bradymonadaceae bacterium]